MKTFKTEKHNIPEGATHYMDQTGYSYFAWCKYVDGKLHATLSSENGWTHICEDIFERITKPIPQTNIETPEEKEVDWANGDKCSYEADNDSHTFIAITSSEKCCIRYDTANNFFEVNLADISKPETPQQREEREAIENLRDAIQQCEDLGLRTYHDEKLVTGAMLTDGVVNLS
jgi:hypothetical protein